MASSLIHGKYVICQVISRTEAQVIEDGAVFQRDGTIVDIGPYQRTGGEVPARRGARLGRARRDARFRQQPPPRRPDAVSARFARLSAGAVVPSRMAARTCRRISTPSIPRSK